MHYIPVPRPYRKVMPVCWPLLSCIIPSYLVCILFGMPSLHLLIFLHLLTFLMFLFSHLGLSLAAALFHFMHKSCWHGWGRSHRRIIRQWYVSKQIYTLLHNIYMYVYTWYSTTVDSCRLDEFFVEMDIQEELLNGTHILYLYHKRFLRLQMYQ